MKRIIDLHKLEDQISPAMYNLGSEDSPRMDDKTFSPPRQSIMDNASGLIKETKQLKIDDYNDKTPEI